MVELVTVMERLSWEAGLPSDSYSRIASAADLGSKQTHKSAETMLDWRGYQSWGSWVSLIS